MSALVGIYKFDPRNYVDKSELTALASGIDRIGPDGGCEYLKAHVGMAYRAFHTTPESKREIQPLANDGCILTWDGRLDNREEIRARVSKKFDCTPTDVELVLAGYKEWGTNCFVELIGDWALAIVDYESDRLLLARDYIGVRRLFYRRDEDRVAWCSTLEPLVLTSPIKLNLDLDYLSGCMFPRPPIETTPYCQIRSVLPATFISFQLGGEQRTDRYWALKSCDLVRYLSDEDYEHHFRELFRTSVARRLRSDRTVLAELSGGLDSSSIVCVADQLQNSRGNIPIETLSYYDTEEPSGDERPYFTMIEKQRGAVGNHISISDFDARTVSDAFMPLSDDYFTASPGCFVKALRWDATIQKIQNRLGARVILSGLGGDEMTGGVQYEAPELAEYLSSGQLVPLARSLYRWSLARRTTIFHLLADSVRLLRARYNPDSLIGQAHVTLPWSPLKPLTHDEGLCHFASWRTISPTHLFMEQVRYGLAQQLTNTAPPLVGCAEKRYPFLDRDLYQFLASIPRTQILQPSQRRHLLRRALKGVVPDGVLFRKTKWFGSRASLSSLRDQRPVIETMFKTEWLSDGIAVNAVALREQLEKVGHGSLSGGLLLWSAIGIEQWLRMQFRRGTLAPFGRHSSIS